MRSLDRDLQVRIPWRLPYRVYLPDGYREAPEAAPYPLIVFLHGAGQRGDDLSLAVTEGLPAKLERGDELPFVVVVPQCPRNLDWSTLLPSLDALVADVHATLRVDPDRVYLTGLSMGGFGVWALATEYPHRFAAAAPICGGGRRLMDFPDRLRGIVHLPVWSFHGDGDDQVPIEESTRLVEALRRYGGNVRSTVYQGVGHDSWTRTYQDPELYRWFLRQVRARPAAEGRVR